jgi:hypothetical protein
MEATYSALRSIVHKQNVPPESVAGFLEQLGVDVGEGSKDERWASVCKLVFMMSETLDDFKSSYAKQAAFLT